MQIYRKTFLYNSEYSLWEVLVRIHLSFKKIRLSEQAERILIYYCMYGINRDTESLMLEEGAISGRQTLRNYKTLLKDAGMIHKVKSLKWEVTEQLKDFELKNILSIIVQCKKQS